MAPCSHDLALFDKREVRRRGQNHVNRGGKLLRCAKRQGFSQELWTRASTEDATQDYKTYEHKTCF